MEINVNVNETVSNVTRTLHNINLDAAKTVSSNLNFSNSKKPTSMSENTSTLSKYFDQSTAQIASTNSVSFFNDVSSKTETKKKEEPIVCRIFAETPTPTKTTDPTTSFFDLIGNKSTSVSSSGIISDIGLGSKEIPDVSFCIH